MAVNRRFSWPRLSPWLWGLTTLVLLLVAAYVVIGRQLMLLVPDYRTQLETLFEERVQTPLTIAELNGKMAGLTPQFVARKIRLPAPEGEAPLELDEVVLSVDVLRSLLHRDLVLEELRITGVELSLVRGEDGRIRLRGLNLDSEARDAPPLERILRLFYRQQLLSIRDARLSLDWPGMPPLAASALDATLINDGDEHRLAVQLEARDRPLSLKARIHLHDDAFTLDDIDADVYAAVQGERLQEWLPEALGWSLDPAALDGRVKLWATLKRGEPYQAQLKLDVPTFTLQEAGQTWPMTDLSLSLALQRDEDHASVSLTRLSGKSPAGALALGDAGLRWETRGDRRQWQLRANELPVHALVQQLQQWPFALPEKAEALKDKLMTFAPRGLLDGLYLSGRARQVEAFQARFTGLSSQADDRIPGVKGLSGWVAGNAEQGRVHLYSDDLTLQLPRLYAHGLSGQMSGVVAWQRQGEQYQVRSGRLRMVNPDAHGEAMFNLRLQPGQIPQMRLGAEIYDGNGARASHYIPLERLPDGLSGWLGQAIRDGRLHRGQFLYQGPVKIDKSRQQDRTFQMRFQGEDVALSILPDWPLATGINADVLINGREVRARARRGQLLGARLQQVYVDVPAFETGDSPHLIVTGQAQGSLESLDALFQQTPLKEKLPEELLDWRFRSGDLQGHLLLDFPLQKEAGEPAVLVRAQVDAGRIENPKRRLDLTEVSAPVFFHLRDGIQIETLKARTLGGQFSGQWLTRDGRSQLQLNGSLPMQQASRWLGFDWLRPLSGTLPLGLKIQVPWRGTPFSLQAASSMKGVAVAAPAPLGKSAGQTRPLDIRLAGEGRELGLRMQYGADLRARFRLGDRLGGDVLVGPGQLRAPGDGVAIRGRLERAVSGDWVDFIGDQLVPALQGESGGSTGGQPRTGLDKISLAIDTLDLFGVPVSNSRLSVLPVTTGWDLALSSQAVAGSMHIPQGFTARGENPLSLSVSRLNLRLPDSANPDKGAPLSPRELPPLNARLENIVVNGESFGDWKGTVRPIQQGVRITDLDGRWRFSRFQGSVDWTEDRGEHYTRYNGSLGSDDLARSLSAWGLPEMIEAEEAAARVSLGWNDWPLSPDYLALEGQARVDIGECRIPDTDTRTSFLRVLGILNLGTIQRRLRLDFSDLYKKGLSCDSISGDFIINGSRVSTSNFAIDSPSAAIRVKGAIDLEKQTLDHQMEVTLPLSSNLYAGCLAGPAACAGIFVVERIWGDKLDKTATMEYSVTGNWANPKVSETEGIFE
ncbi:MAG: TIGR02099 family protein [Pseudomonadales bacterium]|nr:TIGR02099 family protein [Pseudomonadales bacterium]